MKENGAVTKDTRWFTAIDGISVGLTTAVGVPGPVTPKFADGTPSDAVGFIGVFVLCVVLSHFGENSVVSAEDPVPPSTKKARESKLFSH